MEGLDVTLRVRATSRHAVRVTTRGVQLSIGRPVEFDSEAAEPSAVECALAAVGAEIVGGLEEVARRRRLVVDEVEAVVKATLEAPLVYLGVVGESGRPRVSNVSVRIYVSSPEERDLLDRALHDALNMLPLVGTLGTALDLTTELVVA